MAYLKQTLRSRDKCGAQQSWGSRGLMSKGQILTKEQKVPFAKENKFW